MNKLVVMYYEDKDREVQLELRDLVSWVSKNDENLEGHEYMIYKNITGMIGLLNMNTGYDQFQKFTTMDELKEYLLNLGNVKDKTVHIVKKYEWITYIP
jgi:hypothetical protein